MNTSTLEKFSNSEDTYARIDGKIIARKSLYDARVWSEPYDSKKPFIEYKSRIQHCTSCLDERYFSDEIDECCCIHASFNSKNQENQYVKSIGFWNLK